MRRYLYKTALSRAGVHRLVIVVGIGSFHEHMDLIDGYTYVFIDPIMKTTRVLNKFREVGYKPDFSDVCDRLKHAVNRPVRSGDKSSAMFMHMTYAEFIDIPGVRSVLEKVVPPTVTSFSGMSVGLDIETRYGTVFMCDMAFPQVVIDRCVCDSSIYEISSNISVSASAGVLQVVVKNSHFIDRRVSMETMMIGGLLRCSDLAEYQHHPRWLTNIMYVTKH